MKFSRSLALLALVASISGSAQLSAQPTTPFLETASLSFLRAFVNTGVTSTTSGPRPTLPGAPGPLDPDALRPGDRITVDIGAPLYYTPAVGDQTYWVTQSQRTVLERLANSQRDRLRELLAPTIQLIDELKTTIADLESQLAQTSDPGEIAAISTQLGTARTSLAAQIASVATQSKALYVSDDFLRNSNTQLVYAKDEFDDAGARWELTAARAPQRNVEGAVSTPYRIYLSRIDRPKRQLTRTYDTGLRLQPFHAVGSSVETLNEEGVTRATGNYTIHFEIMFDGDLSPVTELTNVNFIFATDPLHLLDKVNFALAEPSVAYNKNYVQLQTVGSGYLTCSIRSTPGPLAAVIPTKPRITGHGTWGEITVDLTAGVVTDSRGGIAPFAIKMSEIKFQSSSLFPDFFTVEDSGSIL